MNKPAVHTSGPRMRYEDTEDTEDAEKAGPPPGPWRPRRMTHRVKGG